MNIDNVPFLKSGLYILIKTNFTSIHVYIIFIRTQNFIF